VDLSDIFPSNSRIVPQCGVTQRIPYFATNLNLDKPIMFLFESIVLEFFHMFRVTEVLRMKKLSAVSSSLGEIS